jgi:ADP-dependent NAD(P)H-hydrate dehydratase / NAD(P)H-hydrate epimerase
MPLPDWLDPLYDAAEMRAADAWAIEEQGVPSLDLMELAGVGLARVTAAIARPGPVRVVVGKGNNGGDGLVAARWLGRAGLDVAVALVSSAPRPSTPDAARNWDRLDRQDHVQRLQAGSARELAMLGQNVARSAVVVDALLGTGVRGALRDPIRSAVELIRKARAEGVPVVAVDTPTAVDLSSGDPSEPVVQADLTVTFHRPKTGLRTRRGAALAGKILVAPIGIPLEADRG